ncbi:hypothetical protein J6590_071177 [Homalodisca vitripennis]|nr:hypothetical protein J6590_071177 [Homalodisca vitripennis]
MKINFQSVITENLVLGSRRLELHRDDEQRSVLSVYHLPPTLWYCCQPHDYTRQQRQGERDREAAQLALPMLSKFVSYRLISDCVSRSRLVVEIVLGSVFKNTLRSQSTDYLSVHDLTSAAPASKNTLRSQPTDYLSVHDLTSAAPGSKNTLRSQPSHYLSVHDLTSAAPASVVILLHYFCGVEEYIEISA